MSRDDISLRPRQTRSTVFSRLEMLIRPLSELYVLELAAKATIRNKEVFNRSHYQKLADIDQASFLQLIDHWALEFAELYAAKS